MDSHRRGMLRTVNIQRLPSTFLEHILTRHGLAVALARVKTLRFLELNS